MRPTGHHEAQATACGRSRREREPTCRCVLGHEADLDGLLIPLECLVLLRVVAVAVLFGARVAGHLHLGVDTRVRERLRVSRQRVDADGSERYAVPLRRVRFAEPHDSSAERDEAARVGWIRLGAPQCANGVHSAAQVAHLVVTNSRPRSAGWLSQYRLTPRSLLTISSPSCASSAGPPLASRVHVSSPMTASGLGFRFVS